MLKEESPPSRTRSRISSRAQRWENIYLYASILGISKQDIKKSISEIIEFSGHRTIPRHANKALFIRMLARLAFSTAVNVNPDILLVDEILSVGDIEFQSRSLNKIKNLKLKAKRL